MAGLFSYGGRASIPTGGASGGYYTGQVGNQWMGGATPETARAGASASAGVVSGDFAPMSELLQRGGLRAIRQRYSLGEEQKADALMGGTRRGLARSGQTAGTLAMVERETGRDVFELQRNLQLQIADLQDRANMRAEARAQGGGGGFGEGGVLYHGASSRRKKGGTSGVSLTGGATSGATAYAQEMAKRNAAVIAHNKNLRMSPAERAGAGATWAAQGVGRWMGSLFT